MKNRELNIVSTVPCANNRGVYDGHVQYRSPSGGMNPNYTYDLDLGHHLPEDLDPVEVVRWMHAAAREQRTMRRLPVIAPEQVIAMSVTRLCFSVQHVGPPEMPAYVSRRRELVCNYFLAAEGVEPVGIDAATFNSNGSGNAMVRPAGSAFWELGLIPPGLAESGHDISGLQAIRLDVPGRHPYFGILNGHEDYIYPSQLSD